MDRLGELTRTAQGGVPGDAPMDAPLILVADDEPHIVRLLSYLLTRAGHRVATAGNGEEALAQLQRLRPTLIFLDVMMPGLDGFQVCARLRQAPATAGTYVIMLSALGESADRERAARCGADEYMIKPFSPLAVSRRVRELLPRPEE